MYRLPIIRLGMLFLQEITRSSYSKAVDEAVIKAAVEDAGYEYVGVIA